MLETDPGIRLGVASVAEVVTLLAVVAFRLHADQALLVLAAVVVAAGLGTTVAAAASTGALGWALYTGFLVNQYGQLTFDGADRARLGLLAGLGALTGTISRPRRLPRHDDRSS